MIIQFSARVASYNKKSMLMMAICDIGY